MSTAFEYEAKIIAEKMKGKELPTFETIIKNIITKDDLEHKTEEMVNETAIKIELPKDHSLQEKIAHALLKFEKSGIVVRGHKRGYWRKK